MATRTSRRTRRAGILLAAALACAGALVPASAAVRPPPGAPDPAKMVLRLGDLSPGAAVVGQGYYRDPDLPSVISYRREFEGARIGKADLISLESHAEVLRSAGGARSFVAATRLFFGSKAGREQLKELIAGELEEEEEGLISNVQFGRPRSLGAGDESFDVAMSFRVLGLRVELHIAVLRVDRVLGELTVAGAPGARLPLSGLARLARTQVAHIRGELVPRNVTPPTIAGTAQVGQALTATPGTWRNAPTSLAFRWQRCDAAGASCVDIAGATGSTYTPAPADTDSTIRVAVTASNAVGSATAVSTPTAAVTGPPVSTAVPTISGTPAVGQTLTAAPGSWLGSPTSFAYQWQRCDTAGANCADVAGATVSTYTLTPAEAGSTVRVAVAATNALGSATAVSVPTPVVA